MKYIVTILRILVGCLFIFSGLIKSNDPTGFSYKLEEYFSVFAEDLKVEQDNYSIITTTLDGTDTIVREINPNDPKPQIIIQCSDWSSVEMEMSDDPLDLTTMFMASGTISCGTDQLYQADFNSMDSNEVVNEVELKVMLNGSEVASEKVAFTTFGDNNKIINLDFSDRVKESTFLVGWMEALSHYALFLAIFICVIEILLGIALLIGWAKNFTLWMLLIMIIFFTFLTWYSHTFNKVTDCGCFGDAIKLTPYESFMKDVILSIAIIIIFIGKRYVKPIFSNPFSIRILSLSAVIVTGFSLYCWNYLPAKNFLKFRTGNDIRKLSTLDSNAKQEIRDFTYIYENAAGDRKELNISEVDKDKLNAEGYHYVDRIDVIVQEGDEPEIHDFKIDDLDGNSQLDAFYDKDRWKIMIVMNDLSKVNEQAMPEITKLIEEWTKAGYAVYPMTASSAEEIDAFKHQHQLSVDFYQGDKTNLKSIIRSNPGLLLFDGSVVIDTWPSTSLPSPEDLIELTK